MTLIIDDNDCGCRTKHTLLRYTATRDCTDTDCGDPQELSFYASVGTATGRSKGMSQNSLSIMGAKQVGAIRTAHYPNQAEHLAQDPDGLFVRSTGSKWNGMSAESICSDILVYHGQRYRPLMWDCLDGCCGGAYCEVTWCIASCSAQEAQTAIEGLLQPDDL